MTEEKNEVIGGGYGGFGGGGSSWLTGIIALLAVLRGNLFGGNREGAVSTATEITSILQGIGDAKYDGARDCCRRQTR